MKKFFVFFFIVLTCNCFANIDSLLQVLAHSKEDTAKVRLLRTLAWKYNLRDADSSLMFSRQSFKLSKKIKDYKGEILGSLSVGGALKRKGERDSNFIYIQHAYHLARSHEDDHLITMCYARLGSFYHNDLYKPDSALYYFDLAEKKQMQIGEHYKLWNIYFSRGELYYKLGMHEKGEAELLKALEITKSKKIRMEYGVVLYRLIRNYFDHQFWDKYSELTEAYFDFLEEGNKPRDISNTFHRSLYFFEDDAKPAEVIPILQNMIEAHEKNNNYSGLVDAMEYLSTVQYKAGFTSDAIHTLKNVISLSEEHGFLVNQEVGYQKVSQIYESNKDPEQALIYYKKYLAIHDSVEMINNHKYLEELEVRFETDKKEAALARQSLELDKQKLSNRNFILLSALLAFTILGITSILWIKQKSNKHLSKKNELITQALDDKELLLREIHHRVKNNLQIISSLLNLQSKYVQDESAVEAIKDGRNRVNSMSLIHQNLYMHENLATMDVGIYLQKLTESLFQSYNIQTDRIQLITQVEPLELDIDLLIPLGLILNELISNALKHAFPDDRKGIVKVILKKDEQQLILEVEDDGVGMKEIPHEKKLNSFGMDMVDAFAQKLKATLIIRSHQGVNTRMVIPYKAA